MVGEQAQEATILKTSMSIMKERCSVDLRKYSRSAKELGHQFGLETAKRFSSSTMDSLVKELGRDWHKNKIGDFHWVDFENGILAINHCSDCMKRSNTGQEHLCVFKEGFLEAILSEKLQSKFNVVEVSCCGAGGACVFEIRKKSA